MLFPSINGGWHSLLWSGSQQLFVQVCSENMLEHLSCRVFDKRWCLGFVTFRRMKYLWKKKSAVKPCKNSNSVHFIGRGRSKCIFFWFCICKIWRLILHISELEYSCEYIYVYLYSLKYLHAATLSAMLLWDFVMGTLGCSCCCCLWFSVCVLAFYFCI